MQAEEFGMMLAELERQISGYRQQYASPDVQRQLETTRQVETAFGPDILPKPPVTGPPSRQVPVMGGVDQIMAPVTMPPDATPASVTPSLGQLGMGLVVGGLGGAVLARKFMRNPLAAAAEPRPAPVNPLTSAAPPATPKQAPAPVETPHGFRDPASGKWAAHPGEKDVPDVTRRDIMTGYDPKPVPQRPFNDDYPAPPRSDGEGRLAYTIDGDPITAKYVAGRRRLGGGDEGISPSDRIYMAGELVDKVVPAPAKELPGMAGVYQRRAGQDGLETVIKYRDGLTPGQSARVISHEAGHAIDEAAGQIDTRGLSQELKQVFHDLATGVQGKQKFRTEPQHLGYKAEEVPRELMAEAIRGYMTDPNYLKSVAPKSAQRIRDFVNTHPTLSKIIQFNALAGITATNPLSTDTP